LDYPVENIETFIDSATKEGVLPAERKIFRYIEEIEKINFHTAINKLLKREDQFLYWEEPALGYSFIAFGSVYSIRNNGPDRVAGTEEQLNALTGKVISNEDAYELKSLPLFVGSLKFAPNGNSELWKDYADSDWFVPQTILMKTEGKYYLVTSIYDYDPKNIFNARLTSELMEELNTNGISEIKTPKIIDTNLSDEAEFDIWKEMIENALDGIAKGDFHKIVLSREIKLTLEREPDLSNLLKQLVNRYPYCYVFAFRKRDSIFFGASPERLAKFSNGYVEADALAGSIPRGKTLEEDRKLEEELLHSVKNLNEQKAVVDFIAQSFSSFADDVEYESKPIIRKLPNIQHLWTPIKAKLRSKRPVFSFLKEVHPTPAICGTPWSAAMNTILSKEKHNRGLYTGTIGWFNFNDEGEFAVAIRSALMQKNNIYAFAGCGIVEGSDPVTEFEETKLKLRPILNLFDYEEKNKS